MGCLRIHNSNIAINTLINTIKYIVMEAINERTINNRKLISCKKIIPLLQMDKEIRVFVENRKNYEKVLNKVIKKAKYMKMKNFKELVRTVKYCGIISIID